MRTPIAFITITLTTVVVACDGTNSLGKLNPDASGGSGGVTGGTSAVGGSVNGGSVNGGSVNGGSAPTSSGGAAEKCSSSPNCNWCGGDAVTDLRGCITGWRCANGADPCRTTPCRTSGCDSAARCGSDDLCWPSEGGSGGSAGSGGGQAGATHNSGGATATGGSTTGGSGGATTCMPERDFTCNSDSDCCVALDSCTATMWLTVASQQSAVTACINAQPQTMCVSCIPPAVQVRCENKRCAGTVLPFTPSGLPAALTSSHCGSVTLSGAGGAAGTSAAANTGGTPPTKFGCGAT